MNYGIVIFPERSVQDLANSYRKRYDPHYSLIPPHITLKESFRIEEEDRLQAVIETLEKIAQSTSPFTLHFTKVSTFYPSNNTIYLAIQNEPTLVKLFEAMHEGHLSQNRPYGFIPHLTIGQKMSTEELQDVYGSLKMMEIKTLSKVDRFHLLYQLEDGAWTVYQTFLLKKD